MKERYNVIVHPSVFLQLIKHIRFATNVNSKFTKAIRDKFYKELYELPNNPKQYPLWQTDFELSNPYRSILIKKRYLIIFYIEETNIFVDYFLDCRMDNSKLF